MDTKKIYLVMNDGEIVFVSDDQETAQSYADNEMYKARQKVAEEWDMDEDFTYEDSVEMDIQAAYDGDYYEIEKVDITGKTEDDSVELSNGLDVEMSDILEKWEH